ncbi:thioredoxin TrxC [Pseudoxanthomonas sp. LH2527]|uniref:thioredoxin TrxC n=1 Tax=Pseudoxanthomonas sp. LH2527 TaxID=2923249 RepID=UPI001F1442A7|nr:thioredoxin TrxC [Pseudoxanthomonas sp. LH2527]MCH6484919.1 thioredoxin TrxC [Pseudoxanthomonas sp. LH2527]
MDAAAHLIACPHCAAMNRVPSERLAEAPQCGRCHEALFTGVPLALGEADFDRHALRSTLPLLVDFWAPWCGPCLQMAPHFERAAGLLEPAMRLAKVDTDASPGLGNRFGIRSIPTLVLLQGGREIARQSGAMQTEGIVRWVREQRI